MAQQLPETGPDETCMHVRMESNAANIFSFESHEKFQIFYGRSRDVLKAALIFSDLFRTLS